MGRRMGRGFLFHSLNDRMGRMARPEKLLSARTVATLVKPGMHSDGGGLYLRIDEKGRKSWILR